MGAPVWKKNQEQQEWVASNGRRSLRWDGGTVGWWEGGVELFLPTRIHLFSKQLETRP